jgi:transcriptional regulator with XRE-family HTH domain/O-methyltransferase involved in polyketide biosynthesis
VSGVPSPEGEQVPNWQLRDRRTRARLSQVELAEAVNQWLLTRIGAYGGLDAEAIARYERGTVRWPNERYRRALRTILRMPDEKEEPDDAALGFRKGWKRPYSNRSSASANAGIGSTRQPTGRGIGTPMSEDVAKPAPPGIDLDLPNAARVYDYFLGGTANWAIDRVFGDQAATALPLAKTIAHINREFLGRVVRHCLRQGVRQFLDIGSGVPTVGNVHEVADAIDRGSRCVYVDYEPVAVAHSRILLDQHGDPGRHTILQARMESADELWEQAIATGILNPDEPIGLIMLAVLHFIPDDNVWPALQRYRTLLPRGSRLAISHMSDDGVPEEVLPQIQAFAQQSRKTSTPGTLRAFEEIQRFFGDFEMEPPGLVWLPEWRLDTAASPHTTGEFVDTPAKACIRGGVAVKR